MTTKLFNFKARWLLVPLVLLTLGVGNVWGTLPANPTWTATALDDIADDATVIIISSSGHALPSTTTSSSPAKISCTVTTSAGVSTISPASGTTLQNLAWTVDKLASSWKFYQEGSNTIHLYLSGTSSNTALRVGSGSSNDQFRMGSGGKLLKVTTATRYVGPYSSGSDWRTYNSETHTNHGSASLTFYVLNTGGGSTPSVTPDPTSLSWGTVLQGSSQGNKTISITGSNLTAGTLTISATGGYSVTPTSKSVSGTLAATTLTVTPPSTSTAGTKNGKVTISGGGLASDVEVNLSMTVNAASTVTWMNNGSEYTTTLVANGSKPEFPSNPSSCDGTSTTFYGWSTSEWSGKIDDISAKTIYTSAASMPTVSSAVTYYAVFATASGGGGSPTAYTAGDEGTYVLAIYVSDTWYALPATPTVSSGKISGKEITVSNTGGVDYVTSANASGYEWTIADATNGQTISDGSKYIYHSNGGVSGTNLTYGTGTTYTWTIASEANGLTFKSTNGSTVNSRGLLASGTTFGGYSLSNEDASGYYRIHVLPIGGGTTYSAYSTTCCTALGTINGSFSLSQHSPSSITL